MATPKPTGKSDAPGPGTACKRLRTPGKSSGELAQFLVPKLKLGSITKSQAPLSHSSTGLPSQKEGTQSQAPVRQGFSKASAEDSDGQPASRSKARSNTSGRITPPAETQQTASSEVQAPRSPRAGTGAAAEASQLLLDVKAAQSGKPAQVDLSSPNFSPRKLVRGSSASQPGADTAVPLACQTAINKRR